MKLKEKTFMKTQSYLTLIVFLISSSLSQAQNLNKFYQDSDAFLKKWVVNGNINYAKLNKNFEEIDGLQKQIADVNLSNASDDQKKSFYINAYNLLVINQITKYYPLKSPLDKSGFFDKFKHKVAGESITLDYIEKKYLILKYQDPRIHFAVSCAAVSCPPLANFAYVPEKLDDQLNERTKFALNLDFVLDIEQSKKQVKVSKIFDWYIRDFGNSKEGIIKFINKHTSDNISKDFEVVFLEYDWSVNAIN